MTITEALHTALELLFSTLASTFIVYSLNHKGE
jgi:hypothetical protein